MFGRNAFCAVAGPMFASQPASTMNAKAIENHVLRVRCTEIAPENYLNLIYTQNGTTSAFGPKQTSRKTQSMSLLGVKRTWLFALQMSAFDPKWPLSIKDRLVYILANEPPNRSAVAPWAPPKFRHESRCRTRDGCVLVARLSRHGAAGPSSCDEAFAW